MYFEGLGCLPGKHNIKVDPNVHPVVKPAQANTSCYQRQGKIGIRTYGEVGNNRKNSMNLTPWVSDMATALKSNGEMRLCIDPQHLNKSNTEGTLPL